MDNKDTHVTHTALAARICPAQYVQPLYVEGTGVYIPHHAGVDVLLQTHVVLLLVAHTARDTTSIPPPTHIHACARVCVRAYAHARTIEDLKVETSNCVILCPKFVNRLLNSCIEGPGGVPGLSARAGLLRTMPPAATILCI